MPNELLVPLFSRYLDLKSCLALSGTCIRLWSLFGPNDPIWNEKLDAEFSGYEQRVEYFYLKRLVKCFLVPNYRDPWEGEVSGVRGALCRGMRLLAAEKRKPVVNWLRYAEREIGKVHEQRVFASATTVAFVAHMADRDVLEVQAWSVQDRGKDFKPLPAQSVTFKNGDFRTIDLIGALLVFRYMRAKDFGTRYLMLQPKGSTRKQDYDASVEYLKGIADLRHAETKTRNEYDRDLILHLASPSFTKLKYDPGVIMGPAEINARDHDAISRIEEKFKRLSYCSSTYDFGSNMIRFVPGAFYGPHHALWIKEESLGDHVSFFYTKIDEFNRSVDNFKLFEMDEGPEDEYLRPFLASHQELLSRPLRLCGQSPEWACFNTLDQKMVAFVSF